MLNGGLTLDWVRQVLGASWPELYDGRRRGPGPGRPVLPAPSHGERTPYMDPGHARRVDATSSPRTTGADCCEPRWKVSRSPSVTRSTACSSRQHRRRSLAACRRRQHRSGVATMLADVLGYPLQAVDVPGRVRTGRSPTRRPGGRTDRRTHAAGKPSPSHHPRRRTTGRPARPLHRSAPHASCGPVEALRTDSALHTGGAYVRHLSNISGPLGCEHSWNLDVRTHGI